MNIFQMRILRDIEKQRKLDLASQKLARKLSAQVEIENSQDSQCPGKNRNYVARKLNAQVEIKASQEPRQKQKLARKLSAKVKREISQETQYPGRNRNQPGNLVIRKKLQNYEFFSIYLLFIVNLYLKKFCLL